MIIQNKKTGRQENVSEEDWQKIKDMGFQAGWMIISKSDKKPEKKIIPKEIINFDNLLKNKKDGSKRSDTVPGNKDVQLDGGRSEETTV